MATITRNQAIAAVGGAVRTIMSATWRRRVDKKVGGKVVARAGDIVTMQFLPKIKQGTKNWTPVPGGQCFGVATRAEADAIKRRNGLVGVLKMSEKGTKDTQGVPRTIPVFDLDSLTFEGATYDIID